MNRTEIHLAVNFCLNTSYVPYKYNCVTNVFRNFPMVAYVLSLKSTNLYARYSQKGCMSIVNIVNATIRQPLVIYFLLFLQ